MKGFALGLAVKQRRKATQKSPVDRGDSFQTFQPKKRGKEDPFISGISQLDELKNAFYLHFNRNFRNFPP